MIFSQERRERGRQRKRGESGNKMGESERGYLISEESNQNIREKTKRLGAKKESVE